MYKKDENFRTWEQLVLEFEKNFSANVPVGTLVSVVMDQYGLVATENLTGVEHRLKYAVRATPYTATRFPRLYHSETYIVSEKGRKKVLKKILADEAWLSVEKVEEAFGAICHARGWVIGVRPYLAEVEQEDGFKSVALATTARDEDGKEHQLLCLITNGLILLDARAKLTPMPLNKTLLRVAGCIFHLEKVGDKLKNMIRG